jgi:hypothetical protein
LVMVVVNPNNPQSRQLPQIPIHQTFTNKHISM